MENTPNVPSFEMPPPPAGGPAAPEKSREQGIEQGGPAKEAAPRAPAQAQPPAPAMPLPADDSLAAAPPPPPPVLTHAPPADDSPAADTDRIEKEWVEKAKNIVAQSRDDPYKQKNQLDRVKADYIQKRFKKTIKVDGPAPAGS